MPEVVGRLPHLDRRASSPASTSPTTRPSRASSASWSPQDYVYSFKRLLDPANKSPSLPQLENASIVGLARAARGGADEQEAVRLRHARSRACARSTATRCRFKLAEPRAALRLRRSPQRDLLGARGARGGRALRRRDHASTRSAPGPFRLKQLAAQLAHRARAQPRLTARCCYDAEPAADDAEGQALAAALQGPPPADDRPGRDLDHRGEPAALAGVPERRARPAIDRPAGRVRRPARCPTASSRRTCAKQGVQARTRTGASDVTHAPSSTWRTRWSAATRPTRWRCAARSPGLRRRARDPLIRRGQAIPAQSPIVPHTSGYDPDVQDRDERLRPGAGARRCSTCTATSTATATAGASSPTARRWCCEMATQPEQHLRASSTSCGRRPWTRSASHRASRPRSGRRT